MNLSDISRVGGKNASTGELLQKLTKMGIKCPGGFATTISAYQAFLIYNQLEDRIFDTLSSIKPNKLPELHKASAKIRNWIMKSSFSAEFEHQVAAAYKNLRHTAVAVRSSATTEDLALASAAGAQETFLNVRGINNILLSIKCVFASLFNSRAIAYRQMQHFNPKECAISVGIQPMIRSDKGASGVLFTLDTESGFKETILISSSYGLGEAIVQGQVNPDEFIVYKPALKAKRPAILQRKLGDKALKMVYATGKNPHQFIKTVPVPPAERRVFSITDEDIRRLSEQALLIEKHYGKPMDIEWAKDGVSGEIYILQARPETVKGHAEQTVDYYTLNKSGKTLTQGQSIGQRIGAGNARIILDPKKMQALKPGDVLVTDMTDPDWEPIMKLASAIVTNRGGRTCHAAIIARELGIPAIVGCKNATTVIPTNKPITVDCSKGQIGFVLAGKLPFSVQQLHIEKMPPIPVRLCINMGNPDMAFATQQLPNGGVGLARLEFIIANIGVHPNAALQFKSLPKTLQKTIREKTAAYKNPVEYYVMRLCEGIATITAAFAPKEVIFRFSDFKSNEYASLLGGDLFEPHEENPMIGFRGASRYIDPSFKKCFELECIAFKRVRNEMKLTNAHVMIPFVRTVKELTDVLAEMAKNGLKRGANGLKVYMMCEIPSNVMLADEFLKHVDGFSIGSNDLTQLTLGLDRDSHLVAHIFDERDQSVKMLLHTAIAACRKQNKYIGICGQAPSDHIDLAIWLMQEGIECMSLSADTLLQTWLTLAKQPVTKN